MQSSLLPSPIGTKIDHMTYTQAVDHLYSLTPELAPTPGGGPARKFDLAHMHTLCAYLGNPQDRVPAILIAGTNGKGSTAATLASILTAAGYRTGLYTSPHLIRPNERIQLAHPTLPSEYGTQSTHGADGPLTLTEIPDEAFARLYTQVDEACTHLTQTGQLPILPSFFERLTALAFLYFAVNPGQNEGGSMGLQPHELEGTEEGASAPAVPTPAEILILEVGLGGRLDATNIVNPLLSILTDIALDHQEYLGNTIAEITAEKCGILRENGILITLPQLPEANHAIGLAATALNVRALNAANQIPPPTRSDDTPVESFRSDAPSGMPQDHLSEAKVIVGLGTTPLPPNHYTLTIANEGLEVASPLPGHHQQRNIALAITAALELRNSFTYNIPNEAIEQGIRQTTWPGRLETTQLPAAQGHGPHTLLLDVAHNPAGAWTLRSAIAALPPARPRTLIFSCLRDKSLEDMSRILFALFDSSPDGDPLRRYDHILLAPIASPRAAHVDDLIAAAQALQVPAHAAPHLAGALAQARQITPPGGLILATGSVYLVGEIRALILTKN